MNLIIAIGCLVVVVQTLRCLLAPARAWLNRILDGDAAWWSAWTLIVATVGYATALAHSTGHLG